MKIIGIFFICCLIWMASCKPATPLQATASAKGDFCGVSSGGPCKENGDCSAGGCSNQVCYAQSEGAPITTCEYKDCFNAKAFGVECRCIEEKCQWK